MIEKSARNRFGAIAGGVFTWVVFASGLAPHSAWGFAEVAGGTVSLETTAAITSDSNITGTADGESDVIYSVAPALIFERRGARGTVNLTAGAAFNRYADFDAQDSDDWRASGHIDIPILQGARTSGSLDFAYFDGKQLDEYLSNRVELRTFDLGFTGRYRVGSRNSLRTGLNASNSRVEDRPSVRSNSVSIGFGSNIRTKLAAFVDYRHTRSKSSSDMVFLERIDNSSDAVLVGLDGDLGTRLTGSIAGGWQQTNARGNDPGGDDSRFIASVGLTWTPRQRTVVSINATSDIVATNALESVDMLGLSLSVAQEIGSRMSATADLGWNTYEARGVSGESNDTVFASLALDYQADTNFSVGAEVAYRKRDAAVAFFDASRTLLSLYGTYKF